MTTPTPEQIERLREWSATKGMGWYFDGFYYRQADETVVTCNWHPDEDANQALQLAERQNLWWDYALGYGEDIGYFVFNWGTESERPYGHPDTTLVVAATAPMALLLGVAAKAGFDYGATGEVKG